MKRGSLITADTAKRVVFQEGRATVLHAVALVVVAFSYLAIHFEVSSLPSCRKGCGLLGVFSSLVAWWPVAVSWWVVKHPGETTVSFRWWQALFCVINVAAAIGHSGSDPSGFAFRHAFIWSILHFALLIAIAPLAIESQILKSGVDGGASPNKSLERTREG